MVYERETPAVGLARLDDIGGPQSWTHYPTGWAQVSNTPLKWYKRDTHGGGIRAPLIAHWPRKIAARGAIRTQFHHVIDIAPTLYELLQVEAPTQYCGTPQLPIHGTSLAYSFDSDEPTRKEAQHFELIGDRAIWQRGWKAVTQHPKGTDFDADKWELYHLDQDFAELNDLAEKEPERLRKLVELWWSEAGKHDVLPLDDRDWERAAERLKMNSTTRYEYFADMARVDRMSAPDISDRSYTVTAAFDADANTEGVILAWGSLFGGIALYVKDAQLTYEYVYSEARKHTLSAPLPQRSGARTVQMKFERTGPQAGRASLSVDGVNAGVTDIPRTWPTHGTTAGLTCGRDAGAPVSDAYERPFAFTGGNLRLTVELDIEPVARLDEAYRAAVREQ
jgi:arylsulfatase